MLSFQVIRIPNLEFLHPHSLKSSPILTSIMRRTRSQTKFKSSPDNPQSATTPAATSSSSQIPFRARKIRKLTTTVKIKQPEIPIPKSPCPSLTPILTISKPLTSEGEIATALKHLRNADPLLSPCIDSFPPPKLSCNVTPFFSLIKSIISQQLSNKASSTIESRFVSLCGGPNSVLPDVVLSLSPQQLRQAGISGPKATYLHDLSTKYVDGVLSDSSILEMDDQMLFDKLISVKGIGPWSVHMFMIFTLHRPDVLPVGDLVVRRGVERLYGLKGLPSPSQMELLCQKWKPYRSVGSWYMYRFVEAKGATLTPL